MDASVASEMLVFEGWSFDLRAGVLLHQNARGNWMPVPIGTRARNILTLLLQTPGALISKDTIMEAVWPGILVEANNLTVQIAALRRLLDQDAGKNSCIQTVTGQGYRFVRPVKKIDEARASTLTPLSITVAPFDNLSGGYREKHLAKAVTEDLTTDLSRIPDFKVLANDIGLTYKRKGTYPKTIGEELGVRYLVEGNIRKVGDILRVNVRLIATETGEHLWADRFDQRPKDQADAQEAIVRRVSQTLIVALVDAESARSKRERPANPDAFDLIIRARSIGLHTMSPREHAQRTELFEEALRLDPCCSVPAMTELAVELIRSTSIFNSGYEMDRAAKVIEDAIAIDPNHLYSMNAAAYLLFHQDRYSEAIAAYRRCLDHHPSWFTAYNQIGFCLVFMGRAQEAIPLIEIAIRCEPRSAFSWSRYENMGFALLMLGKNEESITWTRRALMANPDNAAPLRAQFNLRLGAAYARLGRFDEARHMVGAANRIWPYDTVRGHWPRDPSSRVYAAQMECFQSALRLAGHRDHAEEDADFGVAPDAELHREFAGFTPMTAPGATTVRTDDLRQLLSERKPLVIDPLRYSWGRSIPGAIGLKFAGSGGSFADVAQEKLRIAMSRFTAGDINKPVVAIGWNSEHFDGRNLALRLVALGYTEVYWYRGGREAWELNELPEAELNLQEW